jgi:hypothetical protein
MDQLDSGVHGGGVSVQGLGGVACTACRCEEARAEKRPRAYPDDLLHHLPKDRLRHLLLLVRPETVLRRHRELLR